MARFIEYTMLFLRDDSVEAIAGTGMLDLPHPATSLHATVGCRWVEAERGDTPETAGEKVPVQFMNVVGLQTLRCRDGTEVTVLVLDKAAATKAGAWAEGTTDHLIALEDFVFHVTFCGGDATGDPRAIALVGQSLAFDRMVRSVRLDGAAA